jgi:serine/threonine protein phosphatase Stp1
MSDMPMSFRSAARSDVGRRRPLNEDGFLDRPGMGLWAVADGMGGLNHGQWASQRLIESLSALPPASADFEADAGRVADAIETAHRAINGRVVADGLKIGSTIVALLARANHLCVHWAGDSRLYRVRGDAIEQLTHDHTEVQDLVESGRMSADEAKGHPFAHVLSRAVGVAADLRLERVEHQALAGDLFVLCTDGLTCVVPDEDILKLVSRRPLQAICDSLVELTLQRGAPDNVTVIAIACDG